MVADCGLRMDDSIRHRRCALRLPVAVLLAIVLAACSGCNGPQGEGASPPVYARDQGNGPSPADGSADGGSRPTVHPPQPASGFGPAKIRILPLTELVGSAAGGQPLRLDVYVALLDAFGSQIKSPGSLRFEIYKYVPRSAQRKGQRIAPSRDIDLTDPVENNEYWRELLRAYEFDLEIEADPDKSHVLEVTCVCPEGKRLTSEYLLRGGR